MDKSESKQSSVTNPDTKIKVIDEKPMIVKLGSISERTHGRGVDANESHNLRMA